MTDQTAPTADLASNLRDVADLLAAHSGLPAPCVFAYSGGRVDVSWHLMNEEDSKDDQKAAALAIRKAIGGTWTKNPWGDRFDFMRKHGDLTLQILAERDQMCERVVVGTETITIPAVEAQPERTEEREVVEWRCDPVLTDEAPQAVSA